MQQQQHEGGRGTRSFGGYPQTQAAAEAAIGDEQRQKLGDLGITEAASPISSRPPAAPNFVELIRATAEAGGGSGGASGNRWPRQETMALIRIRSNMDAAFRDTTGSLPKGPLWEQVSRKLGELGYHRSAHKCKEKFKNVHKYYKRTKEGRTGRQDGKSYKFFTELEALHHSTTSIDPLSVLPTTPNPAPTPVSQSQAQVPSQIAPPTVSWRGNIGINFSSDSSSSSEGEDDDEEMETETVDTRPHQRKHKRGRDDSDQGMMEVFEGLMKKVMQKQGAMQQKFIETMEKREQDRMIKEEAWKRQDMARLARQNELLAQERSVSASRDAAIVDLLQKITGQTIQLPAVIPPNAQPPTPPFIRQNQQNQKEMPSHSLKQSQNVETTRARQPSLVASIPEQQIMPNQDLTGGGSWEGTSSRWPKPEILALIQLRSGMESKFQEAVLKGPLWEEISEGMKRMGYNRSAKKCKEKWENINKYYKKVKESKKKRLEDAKTCPYFNELDALYQKKVIGSSGGNMIGSGTSDSSFPVTWSTQQQQEALQVNESVDKDAGGKNDIQTSSVGANKPEDSVRKQPQQSHGNLFGNNVDDSNNDDLDQENDEYNYEEADENEEYDDAEEEMKLDYKIQFQTQKVGSSNGGGRAPISFSAMVQ